MERKEETIASKILVDFIRDFTALTEHQIDAIRKMMEEVVREVMSNVMSMSNLASTKKEQANQVIVSNDKNVSATSLHQAELDKVAAQAGGDVDQGSHRKYALESKLIRTGGLFSKHMEALSRLDSDLQAMVSKVIGSVSSDDVMAQRLNHVISSLGHLQKELSNVLGEYKKFNTPEAIKSFRNRVLTQVYLSYTTQAEREIFHQIFGYPKDVKRAS